MNQKRYKRYVKKHGRNDVAMEMLNKMVYKKAHKQRNNFEMPSLIDGWHKHFEEDDGECWINYGLFDFPDDYTDDEIRECLHEELWVSINSPYDCTGKPFTMWIDWHRNPNGMVSVIHHMGLDV